MPPSTPRRHPTEAVARPLLLSCSTALVAHAADMDDFPHQHFFNNSPLLGSGGGGFGGDDEWWGFHRDPEAESVRSHPSSHHTTTTAAEQSLLLSPTSSAAASPPTATTTILPTRPQPQRLQRRRNQYHYINGVLVPTSPADTRQNHLISPSSRRGREGEEGEQEAATGSSILPSRFHHHRPDSPPKRSKSYSASGGGGGGGASSWLLGSASALVAESKRSSWTGERREIRKLQKEHPVGSARPSFSLEIGDGEGGGEGGYAFRGESHHNNKAGSSSVLGVKRRMERLRGLYRKGDKEVTTSTTSRW